jgi:hypothetical protein
MMGEALTLAIGHVPVGHDSCEELRRLISIIAIGLLSGSR